MTKNSRLALLIPAYNAVAYLPRLLESATQDGGFDEVWVYDDCSRDATADVAEKMGAKVVRGEVNRGCTWGKSILTEKTGCGWFHFHDADDLLLPGFVQAAREWIGRDDADVVVFGCEERWEDTRELISVTAPNDNAISQDPVTYNLSNKVNAISSIYRADAFLAAGGFDLDPEVLYNEDEACHCKLARAGLRFRADERPLIVNLRQRQSMSVSNRILCLRARMAVLKKASMHSPSVTQRSLIAVGLWHVAAGAAAQLDWPTADQAVRLATFIDPNAVVPASASFRMLSSISPRHALRIREYQIRLFRPKLRMGYPSWRALYPRQNG